MPVVIYLHGAPGDIHEGTNFGWPATAAKDCFIEVNAKGSMLSDGVESWHIYNDTSSYSGTPPDDVAQLKSVVAEIENGDGRRCQGHLCGGILGRGIHGIQGGGGRR